MSEADVLKAIIEYLTYQGALILRINSGAAVGESETGKRRFLSFVRWYVLGDDSQTAGVSDILALIPPPEGYILEKQYGRLLAIEVKAPGKKGNVSEAQARFMAAARMRGAVVCVATCVEDVMQALLGVTE